MEVLQREEEREKLLYPHSLFSLHFLLCFRGETGITPFCFGCNKLSYEEENS